MEKEAALPAEKLSQRNDDECGQNSLTFVSNNVDKTRCEGFVHTEDKTIWSTKQIDETLENSDIDIMNPQFCGQKVKSGQNLKENKNKNKKENKNNILSGYAASMNNVDKTRGFEFCPTASKIPDTTFDYIEEDKTVDQTFVPMYNKNSSLEKQLTPAERSRQISKNKNSKDENEKFIPTEEQKAWLRERGYIC